MKIQDSKIKNKWFNLALVGVGSGMIGKEFGFMVGIAIGIILLAFLND